jgi:hypothetical protein
MTFTAKQSIAGKGWKVMDGDEPVALEIPDQKTAEMFAAAPELYAFAKAWVDFRNGTDTDPKELWLMATQAIAKVEGED